jgi:hypothetical protein
MTVPTSFNVTDSNGIRRTIAAIPAAEAERYHLLGMGLGINLGHAVLEGINHCPDFRDRVVGFRVLDDEEGPQVTMNEAGEKRSAASYLREQTGYDYVAVNFYEQRN